VYAASLHDALPIYRSTGCGSGAWPQDTDRSARHLHDPRTRRCMTRGGRESRMGRMTDHSSESRRRRRRSGRHQQPARRRASPLPPDEARRNRDAAFGTSGQKRTWVSGGTPSTPAADGPSDDASAGSRPQASSPGSEDAAASAGSPAPSAGSEPRDTRLSPGADEPAAEQPAPRARGRRAAFPLDQLAESPADGAQSPDAQSPDAQ